MSSRPNENASSAEIARWMEEDFWEGIAEAAEDAVDDSSMEE